MEHSSKAARAGVSVELKEATGIFDLPFSQHNMKTVSSKKMYEKRPNYDLQFRGENETTPYSSTESMRGTGVSASSARICDSTTVFPKRLELRNFRRGRENVDHRGGFIGVWLKSSREIQCPITPSLTAPGRALARDSFKLFLCKRDETSRKVWTWAAGDLPQAIASSRCKITCSDPSVTRCLKR